MWNLVQEITKHLVTLALVGLYLAYTTSKFEVIAVSILLLIYVRLDNRILFLAAKADYFMTCSVDGVNRIRQGIHDPEYDSVGESRGITRLDEAAKKLMTYSKIDDVVFFALLLIVAMKLFVTVF